MFGAIRPRSTWAALTVGLISIVNAAAHSTSFPEDRAEYFQDAKTAIQNRRSEALPARDLRKTYSEACSKFDDCDSWAEMFGDWDFLLDNYDTALNWYRKAIGTKRGRIGAAEPADTLELRAKLAFTQHLSQPSQAPVQELHRLLSEAELQPGLEYKLVTGRLHARLSRIDAIENHLPKAEHRLELALGILENGESFLEAAEVAINLATVRRLQHNYTGAQQALWKSLLLAAETNKTNITTLAYGKLAKIYEIVGDGARALEYATLALEMEGRNGRLSRAADHALDIGNILRAMGKASEGRQYHEQAMRRFIADGDEERFVKSLAELAADDVALNDPAPALEKIAAIEDLQSKLSTLVDIGDINLTRIKALTQQGAQDQATEELVTRLSKVGQLDTVKVSNVELLNYGMRHLNMAGHRHHAISLGHKLVETIEAIRRGLLRKKTSPTWSARTQRAFEDMALLILNDSAVVDEISVIPALDILETNSSRSLPISAAIFAQEHGKRRQSGTNVARTANQLAGTETNGSSDKERYRSYLKATEILYANNPGFGVDTLADPRPTEEVQRDLLDNEMAIRYWCHYDRRCFAFTITNRRARIVELAARDRLLELSQELIGTSLKGNSRELKAQAESLGALLLGKLDIGEETTKLIVIPDEPLERLPFALLRVDSNQGPNSSYLADRYELTHAPSLGSFRHPANQYAENARPMRRFELALIANPIFSDHPNQEGSQYREQGGWSASLEALPWTAREAKNLENIYHDEPVLSLTGDEASRTKFLSEDTRHARILHIATHAYFNPDLPEVVGFALTPEIETKDEGFLSFTELLEYPFHSELVVISGCDTGRGVYAAGEGPKSLAHGFLLQGAESVLATLWSIPDNSASQFMSFFYTHMKKGGLSAGRALREAQIDMRRKSSFKDPVHWAGYFLVSVN